MSLEASVEREPSMSASAVFDLTVLKQLESELATVQVIVETFQAGTYGQCVACGAVIERDLLRVNPLRTTCPSHENSGAQQDDQTSVDA
jgi:RNA polymerase-binding transcription factor DksA